MSVFIAFKGHFIQNLILLSTILQTSSLLFYLKIHEMECITTTTWSNFLVHIYDIGSKVVAVMVPKP